eukprot:15589683-Heterocapsa_arctica.AAC.1
MLFNCCSTRCFIVFRQERAGFDNRCVIASCDRALSFAACWHAIVFIAFYLLMCFVKAMFKTVIQQQTTSITTQP